MTNKKLAVFTTLAASNHSKGKRQKDDYYATEPKAMHLLLEREKFSDYILEPACGEGHLSKVLESYGYNVTSEDLIDRGFGNVKDFFERSSWRGDIITNPPYKIALDFLKHSLAIIPVGNRVAMFLKIQFLEGKSRKQFFLKNPPKLIYVSSSRLNCAKNGDFDKYTSSAVCYAWFIFEKGYKGKSVVEWIN